MDYMNITGLSQKITVITGHYGAGKTNFAVNLALWAKKNGCRSVTIVDLDIVNPYFRTADFGRLFEDSGISLAASDFANSSLDIPALNIDVKGLANKSDRVIIDVGGDGEGAKVLGRFAPYLEEIGYDMVCVINQYRYMTQSSGQAIEIMRGIENSCGLKCTAIFNNSNLGKETSPEVVAESLRFAEEAAALARLPILEFPVEVYVKPIWSID
jgi:hypothetical protein